MTAVTTDAILLITLLGSVSLTTAVAYAQRVGYPLMALVDERDFVRYEAFHVSRISPVVAFGLAASGLGSLVLPFLPYPFIATSSAFALIVGVAITTLGAVVAHSRLGQGFDAAAHAQLLRWNRRRLICCLAQSTILTALALSYT